MADSSAVRPAPIQLGEARQMARDIRRSWEEFFRSGTVPPKVRPTIAESWIRSRELGISPTQRYREREKGFERLLRSQLRQLLIKAGERVLTPLEELTSGARLTLTLADADGLVLLQRGDGAMLKRGVAMGIVPGSRWSEFEAGTNGMGTALFVGHTTQVFAAEHYVEGFHSLLCTASPVRHPLTGQILGVFDITMDFSDANASLWALVTQSAASVEAEIRNLLISSDQRLLEALALASDGLAAYAVDLEGQHTIGNRGATAAIGPEDHAALWRFIKRALTDRDLSPIAFELNSGREVTVHVNPIAVDEETVGALVVLRDRRRARHPGKQPAAEQARYDWSPFNPATDWLAPAEAAAASSAPALVIGEPGAGKSALAAAIHRNRGDGGPLTIIDCASLDAASWDVEWRRALAGGPAGSVLLERLPDLQPSLQPALIGAIDHTVAVGGPRILATAATAGEASLRNLGLREELLDRVSVHLVSVPPLRERPREFERIVRDVLAYVGESRLPFGPPITDEALAVLGAYHWPGNVRQLQNVLYRALALRPRVPIDVKSLPPVIVASAAGPHLGRIEHLEVEAILGALRVTGGNVSRAAEHLGFSRATLYRRLHAYQMLGRQAREWSKEGHKGGGDAR